MIMDLQTLLAVLPDLLRGALVTLQLVAVVLVVGFLIALPVALARNARFGPLRAFGSGFVFAFRGAPVLVLLYLVYYGLPQFAWIRQSAAWVLLREPYFCAVVALSLNSAGYAAEILAGAFRAVPRGEVEAALAVGMPRLRVFRSVIVPHAARLALRGYGNEIVFVVKGTAVVSMVTIIDLMGAANAIYFSTYDPFTPLLAAGVIYLAIVGALTRSVGWLERAMWPELRAAPATPASARSRRAMGSISCQ
jgi:His/Glu/Gln/Arg/opine family amino acid ABC transporter permease subunit